MNDSLNLTKISEIIFNNLTQLMLNCIKKEYDKYNINMKFLG
jgi:hypothetical protein